MLDLITIPKLNGKDFFVPSYQRGYRWTKNEIAALLNDVAEFDISNGNWYCLQPIVVKKLPDNRYELVDGQQRLTTLFIILQTMSEWLSNDRRQVDKPNYTIEYQTRQGSKGFLKNALT